MSRYVNVRERIGVPSAITQEEGNLIYEDICSAIESKEEIEIDFIEIESMIPSFLNNAIGKLYAIYSSEQITTYLKIKNVPREKISTINMVINNAKRYYADKANFEKIANLNKISQMSEIGMEPEECHFLQR